MTRGKFSIVLLVTVALLMSGCQAITYVSTTAGVLAGTLTEEEAAAIRRTAAAASRAAEDITPEQEYYIGRAVGATILSQYRPFNRRAAEDYLNTLGQALAFGSNRPETFSGYRFKILDSDEINAFAAPSGFIFISRGMLRLCENEDELAAVIAHEIGHVEHKHGLRAIRTGRITTAVTVLGTESARQLGGEEIAELTDIFDESINDITSTLVNSGYSRRLEREADRSAVAIMEKIGYNPHALVNVLEKMAEEWEGGGPGFMTTHPHPDSRIRDVNRAISVDNRTIPDVRVNRYRSAMAGI